MMFLIRKSDNYSLGIVVGRVGDYLVVDCGGSDKPWSIAIKFDASKHIMELRMDSKILKVA